MLQRLHTLRPEPRGCGGRLDHDKNQRRPRKNSCETRESVVQRTSASLRTGSTTSRLFPSNTVNKSHLINIATQPQLCCCLGGSFPAAVFEVPPTLLVFDRNVFLITIPARPPAFRILMKCCRNRNAVSPVRIGKFCWTSLRSLPPNGGLATTMW